MAQVFRFIAIAVLIVGIVRCLKRHRRGSVAISAAAIILLIAVLACRAATTGFFPLAGLQDVLVFLGVVLLTVHWVLSGNEGLSRTAPGVYAAVGVMLAISASLPTQTAVPEDLRSYMLPIHVGGAILAYGCMTLHMVWMLQWGLRKRRTGADTSPELETLSRRAIRLALAGEIVYAIFILGMGMLWAKSAWGRYWGWDFKETMSLITFGAYALYLYFELVIRPRSRLLRIAMAAIAYACLLITFFLGARFSALHGYA